MSGWFKKEITSVADLKGLKMRIPGLAGRVYANLGVDVKVLPGGEIFPALERGVIDAAEFVGPFQDRRLGLQKAAKFYYTTGWHESATVSELLINKAAWQKLPKDLQSIVENAAAACNVISEGWCQRNNSEAMEDLIRNQKVVARPLPDAVIKALREETEKVLAEAIAKDAEVGTIVVKLGRRGSIILHEGARYEIGIEPVEAVDSTGAGDAYAGGYLYGLTRGWSPERCGKLASAVAAATVGQLGAVVSDSARLRAIVARS
jgi:hypothetical protein